MEPRRSPFALVTWSVYYCCLFSSLSWSFTDFVIFRIPRGTAFRTTLIQYTDDHTPTPFSETVPASPYKALMVPKEGVVPLPAPLVLPRPKQAVAVPVAAVKASLSQSASPKTNVPETKTREWTLYEVLGVSPTATREEMKLRYNALVKRHHPDAVKHRPPPRLMFVGPGSAAHSFSSSQRQQQQQQQAQQAIKKEPDYGEITAAWAVLSDEKARRKYDRGLLYQKWADQASKVAMKTMEDAAPVMAKMMDTVAVPFMETTAVSTAKIAKAAYHRMGESILLTATTTTTVPPSPPDEVSTVTPTHGKGISTSLPPSSVPFVGKEGDEEEIVGVSTISMNEVVSKITLPARPVINAPVPEKATPLVPPPPRSTTTTTTPTTITPRTKSSSTTPFFSDPVPTRMTNATKKKKEEGDLVSTNPRHDVRVPMKKIPKTTTTTTDAMKLPLWTLLLQMILFV